MVCFVKLMSEIRQPLSDIVDLYCLSVAESQIDDSVNFMSTLTAAAVTDVMQALQQACRSLIFPLPLLNTGRKMWKSWRIKAIRGMLEK